MSRFLSDGLVGLCAYVPGEQPRGTDYIKLNTNESPFAPSPKALNELTIENGANLRRYCDPSANCLVEAIANYYGVLSENVVVSNGSDEILAFAFYAYGQDKPTAFADITYGFYKVFANLYNLKARIIPLSEDFKLNAEDYLKAGENVVIANPNAPTGLCIELSDIEKICAVHKDDIVIIDEAYVDFGSTSAVSLINKYDNLIVVQTFSKSRSLAGARVGFAIACKELCADLQRVRNSFNPYNVNALSQKLAACAISDKEYFNECTNEIIKTRESFTQSLRKIGFTVLDSKANFVFVKKQGFSGEQIYAKLKENGILVRWFNSPRIEDFVRISIGTKEEMNKTAEVLGKR